MVNYEDMSAERIEAAQQKYIPLIGNDSAACEKIRDDQWERVFKNEADMDAAFVLAVENHGAN